MSAPLKEFEEGDAQVSFLNPEYLGLSKMMQNSPYQEDSNAISLACRHPAPSLGPQVHPSTPDLEFPFERTTSCGRLEDHNLGKAR